MIPEKQKHRMDEAVADSRASMAEAAPSAGRDPAQVLL